jgi:hypothetical protein
MNHGDRETADGLPEIFFAGAEPLRVLAHQLAVIVHPADRAEDDRREYRDPDKAVAEIGPQQRRDQHRDQDQRAAHGRRASLGEMGLRAVVTHHLSDLVLRQLADQRRADGEADRERGQHAENRAQGLIAKDVEGRDVLRQPVEQGVQHVRPPDRRRCRRPRFPCDCCANP